MVSKCEKLHSKKLDARLGTRVGYGKSSDLHSGLELALLSSLGIENRVIGRAIG